MQRGADIGRIPELRNKLLFTAVVLLVYRLGTFVPTPGINGVALKEFFDRSNNTIFGMFNMFGGGALERASIFALGIMPYITISIIVQVLTYAIPYLEELQKEGELGRRKLNQYTRYGTVVMSLIQGVVIAQSLQASTAPGGVSFVLHPGWGFVVMTAITLTTGTTLLMWLGETITERGIGNGISLLIAAGIIAGIPSALANWWNLIDSGEMSIIVGVFILAMMAAVVVGVVFMETSHRRIPIQYARRVRGRKMYGGMETHLPIKINSAGVVPPIFASSLLLLFVQMVQYAGQVTNINALKDMEQMFSVQGAAYNVIYFLGIIFFAYFYTAIVFNPVDIAENIKKSGGNVVGIRPGAPTATYIDSVLSRLTLVGALYMGVLCVLPSILTGEFNLPFFFGGTSILIAVGVAMDTMQQIETQLIARNYEGFGGERGQRMRGRRTRTV